MANTNIIPDDADRLLSVQEVAERLGTNDNTVRKLLDAGKMSYIRFGRYRRIRKVVFNQFLADYDGQDLHGLVGGL